jgi:hypothetical protein
MNGISSAWQRNFPGSDSHFTPLPFTAANKSPLITVDLPAIYSTILIAVTTFLKRVELMSSGSTIILAALAVIVICVAVSAASKRPAAWNYYHFDGHGFVAGRPADGSPFLAVRDRIQPVVLTSTSRIEAVALPPDKGALAGFCYIRSSGGKLAGGSGHVPSPGITVSIFSGNTVVLLTQTDEYGYFVALLPAGVYRISSGAFAAEAAVEAGKTTLSALQTGKRMVD